MKHAERVTLAVLAGGQGRRMGIAKGELRIGGRPILEHLLSKWNWSGPTLLVTAPGRQRPPGHDLFNSEAVDPVAGEGPLRGLLTALQACGTSRLVVTTVDMPEVDTGHLDWFVRLCDSHVDALGAFVTRNGRIEPFPCALRVQALAVVQARFNAGLRGVQGLAGDVGFVAVPRPPEWKENLWINLNRPEDLQKYQPPGAT